MKKVLVGTGIFAAGMITHKRVMRWAWNSWEPPHRRDEPTTISKNAQRLGKVLSFFI